MNLRSQFEETFRTKVFADNIVYKGKQMKLTDAATYEMVHLNLNALEIADETGFSIIGRNVTQTS